MGVVLFWGRFSEDILFCEVQLFFSKILVNYEYLLRILDSIAFLSFKSLVLLCSKLWCVFLFLFPSALLPIEHNCLSGGGGGVRDHLLSLILGPVPRQLGEIRKPAMAFIRPYKPSDFEGMSHIVSPKTFFFLAVPCS